MSRHHMINNVQVPFTAQEETAQDAVDAAWTASTDDRAFAKLREERNRKLADSDWWVTRGSITDEQTSYRQALRDLPANTADPTNIAWPSSPDSS